MAAKSKIRRIVTNPRVVIVILAVLIAVYSTGIPFSLGREGVVVRSIEKDSAAYDAGIRSSEGTALAAKEAIIAIDGQKIRTVVDYADAVSGLEINQTLLFETNRAFYRVVVKPDVNIRVLPELEEKVVIVNTTTNETKKILVNKTLEEVVGVAKQQRVCPYEIAALAAKKSAVVIADYNYIFNSKIRGSFFRRNGKSLEKCIIIVDEAHNLPSRMRDMLTERLSTLVLERAIKEAEKFGEQSINEFLAVLQHGGRFPNGKQDVSAKGRDLVC